MLEELQKRFDEIKDRRDDVTLRIHRAISWAKRGLEAEASEDPDAACIFFWIAFNAMYARKADNYSENQEQRDFQKFLDQVKRLDTKGAVLNALKVCWNDAKSGLIDNQYVYRAFWTQGPGGSGGNRWKEGFDKEIKQVDSAAHHDDYLPGLSPLFDRLYVLRNQLHHGGATESGSKNRRQVDAGATVMAALIPAFIGVMIANPDPVAAWGKPYYPPV